MVNRRQCSASAGVRRGVRQLGVGGRAHGGHQHQSHRLEESHPVRGASQHVAEGGYPEEEPQEVARGDADRLTGVIYGLIKYIYIYIVFMFTIGKHRYANIQEHACL